MTDSPADPAAVPVDAPEPTGAADAPGAAIAPSTARLRRRLGIAAVVLAVVGALAAIVCTVTAGVYSDIGVGWVLMIGAGIALAAALNALVWWALVPRLARLDTRARRPRVIGLVVALALLSPVVAIVLSLGVFLLMLLGVQITA